MPDARHQKVQRASRDVVIGGFAVVASTFLPWAASGSVTRSGWEVVSSARRLGVADEGAAELLAAAFFLVPAFAFISLIGHALERHEVVMLGAACAVVATVVVAGAIVTSQLEARWGLWLNIGLGVVDGILLVRLWRVVRATG